MELSTHRTQIVFLLKGVLIAFAITSIALLAYALLVTYTNMSESILPTVIAITTLLSVMVAGFDAARGAQNRGWLWGMCAGLLYATVLAILMIIAVPSFAVDTRTLTTIAIAIAGGGLGGMLGINLGK